MRHKRRISAEMSLALFHYARQLLAEAEKRYGSWEKGFNVIFDNWRLIRKNIYMQEERMEYDILMGHLWNEYIVEKRARQPKPISPELRPRQAKWTKNGWDYMGQS